MTDLTRPDLTGHLRALDVSVISLRDEVVAERRARESAINEAKEASRRSRWALWTMIGLATIGAVVNLGLIVRMESETASRHAAARTAAVVTCENGNITRAAIVDHVDGRIAQSWQALARISAQGGTPEDQVAQEALLASAVSELALTPLPQALGPRDCSPATVLAPTTLTGR